MKQTELSCEEVIKQLFDYLDRELDRQTDADIEYHLQRCRGCFSRAEFERKLRAKIADIANQKAPARLYHRIDKLLENY